MERDAGGIDGRQGGAKPHGRGLRLAWILTLAGATAAGPACAAIATGGFGVSAVVNAACVLSVSTEQEGASPASPGVTAKCTVETPHALTVQTSGETGRDQLSGDGADDPLLQIIGDAASTPHISSAPEATARQVVVTITY